MTLYLKIMKYRENGPGDQNEFSLYGDITHCHFRHLTKEEIEEIPEGDVPGITGAASIWVREPIKTAACMGFHEDCRTITFGGPAYLMNESGRTVATFVPR